MYQSHIIFLFNSVWSFITLCSQLCRSFSNVSAVFVESTAGAGEVRWNKYPRQISSELLLAATVTISCNRFTNDPLSTPSSLRSIILCNFHFLLRFHIDNTQSQGRERERESILSPFCVSIWLLPYSNNPNADSNAIHTLDIRYNIISCLACSISAVVRYWRLSHSWNPLEINYLHHMHVCLCANIWMWHIWI